MQRYVYAIPASLEPLGLYAPCRHPSSDISYTPLEGCEGWEGLLPALEREEEEKARRGLPTSLLPL